MPSTASLTAVGNLYQAILGRAADTAGQNYWATQIDNGSSVSTIAGSLASSGEAQTYVTPIYNLYQAFLGRAPDAAGLAYWEGMLHNGTSLQTIANGFANSTEFTANNSSVTTAITNFYQFGLGRSADTSGYNYWVAQAVSGASLGTIGLAIADSTEALSTSSIAGARAASFLASVGVQVNTAAGTTLVTAATLSTYLTATVISTAQTAATGSSTASTTQTYTLTTGADTLPTSGTGTLPANSTVSGVNNNTASATTGSTFNTGDSINGNATTLNITETIGNAVNATSITATLNGVTTINHQALGGGGAATAFYNESLYTGVLNENITKATAGNNVAVTNASTATTFGISASTATGINVSFASGTSNATLKLSANGAGSATNGNYAWFGYGGNTADINTITLATAGADYLNLFGTTNVSTLTITGSGTGNVVVGNGTVTNAIKQSALTVDASATTANLTVDLTNNYASSDTIKGSTTSAVVTTLGIKIAGSNAAPTSWTNIGALQIDPNSTGTLSLSGVTSVTTVVDADTTASVFGVSGSSSDIATLTSLGQLTSLVFAGAGNATQAFGTVQLGGNSLPGTTDSVAITFTDASTLSSTVGASIGGQLVLSGAETVTLNTANIVGSAGSFTLSGGLADSTLKSFTLTNASTGTVSLGTISGAPTSAGTLTSFTASADAGNLSVGFAANELATGASITGAVGVNNITLGSNSNGASVSVALGNGSNSVTGGGNDAITLVAGNGNNTIATGSGADSITVGSGSNTINAGGGTNAISLAQHAGNNDAITVNTSGAATTVTGLGWGASSGDTAVVSNGALILAQAGSVAATNPGGVGVTITGATGSSVALGTHGATDTITYGTAAVTTGSVVTGFSLSVDKVNATSWSAGTSGGTIATGTAAQVTAGLDATASTAKVLVLTGVDSLTTGATNTVFTSAGGGAGTVKIGVSAKYLVETENSGGTQGYANVYDVKDNGNATNSTVTLVGTVDVSTANILNLVAGNFS